MQSGKALNSLVDYQKISSTIAERQFQTQNNAFNLIELIEALIYEEETDKHLGILLNEIFHTHSNYWALKIFMESIAKIDDLKVQKALTKVAIQQGLNEILEQQSQLFEYKIMIGEEFTFINEARDQIIRELKNDALGLVEALQYDENALRSAFGGRDRKIYETLFHWAKDINPVNDPAFQDIVFERIKAIRGPKQ